MTATALTLVQAMVRTSLGRMALICERESFTSNRPIVLLVHGALRRSDVLGAWYPILSPHYDVFLADMPGHGRSPAEGPASIESIGVRLREIIHAHFRNRAIVIVGESTGGIVAASLADGNVAAVRGVIAFAVRDRELARGFDEVEQRLAALLEHELPDELAEPMDVLAQRTILLREKDVGADGA